MLPKAVFIAIVYLAASLVTLLICAATVAEVPPGEEMSMLGPGIVMILSWVLSLVSAPLWGRSYSWWSQFEPRAVKPWLLFPIFVCLGSLSTGISLFLLLGYAAVTAL